MKNFSKGKAIILAAASILSLRSHAQTDTLHLYYNQIKTQLHDTSLAKMDRWIKSLNGNHTTINVVAYYSQSDYKKYAQERADDLFLVINRKARPLFTIETIGPKKGKNSQRSTVDIIYMRPVSPAEAAAAEAKLQAQAAEKAEAIKTAAAEKERKEAEKKEYDKVIADKKKEESKQKSAFAEEIKKKEKAADTSKDVAQVEEKKEELKEEKKDEQTAGSEGSLDRADPGSRRGDGALNISGEEIAMVKTARIILTMTRSPYVDSILVKAVRDFWTFNKNVSTMPLMEAYELAKTDKNVLLLFTTDIYSILRTKTERRESHGKGLVLEKGKSKVLLTSFFPGSNDPRNVTQETVDFAVSAMNSLLTNMDEQKLNKYRRINLPFEKNSALLKDKTLLIPSGWLSKGLKPAEVGSHYHGKFEVVTYDVYRQAIINKKNYAYVMPVPFVQGGVISIYDYLMDAETGSIYYIHRPSMFQDLAKIAPIGDVYDLANSENISARNLEKYNKAFEKKGDKNDEEGEKTEAKVDEKKTEKD